MRTSGKNIIAALALAASSLGIVPASAEQSCQPLTAVAGFELLIAVEGQSDAYRLTCRDRQLTAVPQSTAAGTDTGVNAAGVAGQTPTLSVSEAVARPADGTPAGMPKSPAGADGASLDKAPIPAAAAAAPDRTGGAMPPKDESRIERGPDAQSLEGAPEAPLPLDGTDAQADTEPKMIRVPAAVMEAAALAVPGAEFKSAALQRDGASTVYRLTGATETGRAVAIAVDKGATVLAADRQVDGSDVPASVRRIADALLPGAEIDRTMLSARDNFEAFFVFTGRDAGGRPITVEIRSDGRSIRFIGED